VGGQVTIETKTEWLCVLRDDRLLDDFDEHERSRLGELVREPEAYLIEWKGGGLVESLLRSIPSTTRAAIDNDHGLLTSVHEIAGKPLVTWIKTSSLQKDQ
jgi:hypothetical protein